MAPDMLMTLKALWNKKDYAELKLEIHKLHGACCYIGAPRLQSLADELESALKLGQHFLVAENLPLLLDEIERVCSEGQTRTG